VTDITIRETWTAPTAPTMPPWLSRVLRRADALSRLQRIRMHSRASVIAGNLALSKVRLMADVGGDPQVHRDRDNWLDSFLRHSFR
jgi:hypothetical protein